MRIETCIFMREKESKPEPGLLINEGELLIDSKGQKVRELYLWDRSNYFVVELLPIFEKIREEIKNRK